MSLRTMYEWMQYAKVEPFGERRADFRAALIACVIANTSRDPKKRPRPFEVEDFLLDFEVEDPITTPETTDRMFGRLVAINELMGGDFVDLRNDPQ